MGKKSKRNRRSGSSSGGGSTKPPALRSSLQQQQQEEETRDNLQFQDPFVDELIVEEEEEEQQQVTTQEHDILPETTTTTTVQAWNPFTFAENETLEMDESAYKMHHALTVEWPCLSFDFCRDTLGESRTRFPHSLVAVAGTQAPHNHPNKLQLLKLSDLDKIKHETEDDVLGEKYGANDDDNDSTITTSSSESSVDLDPVLENFHYPHDGGVNRVRTCPHSTIVASWSDKGSVHLFDVQPLWNQCSGDNTTTTTTTTKQPFFTYTGHSNEGFAMDWSSIQSTQLATGDMNGNIHAWQAAESRNDWNVTPMYESDFSVEDLQWSPTETTVLAACECQGSVKIYDIRAPHRSMLSHKLSNHDMNVMSWNKLVGNLLCTGDDDGVVSVWDLRNFAPKSPLARFTSHKTPITSVEWHPTDESMLAVTDDVGTYIYDLSVEEEYVSGKEELEDIPPQLLFVHCGSQQFKEVHWHPQITSCLMTTALSGFSVFIPSNL